MKFLVDMNLSPTWVDFLLVSGFEAVHWAQIGAHDAGDAKIMQWTADHDHIVLTSDLDFGAILASTQSRRPSVLQLRSDILTPTAIGPVVIAAIRHSDEELRSGALVSVDAVRARLRILPLNE
jgi:predicted nuclease of predicted toxin-antitoxin system